ncbi:hypothetical protein ACE1CI_17250 [Aerosakkonemataceae cyanobacterium BLCC-F50]|uniref:Uncharacterized protein n=1 Tax=Floridaenema flaviceps BLCC-F50 TaxID=3153642 RepID=A0ABV4XT81_9CYAN
MRSDRLRQNQSDRKSFRFTETVINCDRIPVFWSSTKHWSLD